MKKKIVLLILFGIGMFITGVGAAIVINAKDVVYKDNKSVEQELNDLYSKSNYGDATASDIKEGKKALVNGKQITGTLRGLSFGESTKFARTATINCEVGDMFLIAAQGYSGSETFTGADVIFRSPTNSCGYGTNYVIYTKVYIIQATSTTITISSSNNNGLLGASYTKIN